MKYVEIHSKRLARRFHLVFEILQLISMLVDWLLASERDVKTGTITTAATPPSNKTPATVISAFAAGLHVGSAPAARLQKKTEVFCISRKSDLPDRSN